MLESLLFLFFFKKINIFSCFKRNVIASLLQENGNLLVKKKCDSSQNFTIRRHVKQLLSLRHHRCILASFRLSMAGIATCYYLTLSSTRSTAAANKLEQAGFQNIAGMMKMILLPR
ncbi:hypothetical protein ERO13_D07G042533v2 [Gossypium hirsutum]|uniref:Uncharacterized protein isoform X3 n=2 Tax=Gossypium TaxID=3633 RepID=A0ABM3AE21_GOSHI|nr:uncharacterized protein LOC107953673 isoform X3 [Gossypium hirsutum]KAG4136976.1 hypothetical protein ERO13_D07G042533v2 [Gossypium hirsutum]TYI72229.1 hypothetical protein E1A91_D07G046200v1 [Gossypium mustelinum]